MGKPPGQRTAPSALCRTCALATCAAVWTASAVASEDVNALVREATAFYASGSYEEAAARYGEAARLSPGSPDILFALGNASLKSGRIGEAILAYERALRLRPRDRATRDNLRLARLATADQFVIPAPSRLHALVTRMCSRLTLNEAVGAAAALYWGICLALAGRLAATGRRVRRTAGVLALCLLVLLCATAAVAGAKAWQADQAREAIVLAEEVPVRAGPGEGFSTLFSLHEGTKVRLAARQGVWQEVTIPTGTSGWIRCDAFEEI